MKKLKDEQNQKIIENLIAVKLFLFDIWSRMKINNKIHIQKGQTLINQIHNSSGDASHKYETFEKSFQLPNFNEDEITLNVFIIIYKNAPFLKLIFFYESIKNFS